MVYKVFDRLNFGKYQGYYLFEIYQFQPSYIDYLIVNSYEFNISLKTFNGLETPTPFNLCRLEHHSKIYWVSRINPKYDYIKAAYQYILEGNHIPQVNFSFSEMAINKMLP